MELSLTQLAVKILFDGSIGSDVTRWTLILPEEQKQNNIVYALEKDTFRIFTLDRNIY